MTKKIKDSDQANQNIASLLQPRYAPEMKVAILSDIHGNLAALEAVLKHAAERQVDQYVNLGDICSGPLLPCETADRLMALAMPTICGNHERQLIEYDIEAMGPSDRYATSCMRPDQLEWLASLPSTYWLNDEILMVHGTPDSDLGYFLETVTADGLRPATMQEMMERAGNTPAKVILCGHTHIPRIITLDDGRMVVNPGSVGLPAYDDIHPFPHMIECGSPHARYAILSGTSGNWQAELYEVEYDWEQVALTAEANNRPEWAKALRTGYM